MTAAAGTPTGRPVSVRPWRDVRVLRIAGQLLIVLVVAAIVLFLWANLSTNMARANLGIGFGFLNTTAGFEIAEKAISYSATDTYGRAFVVGLLNTLMVSAVGIVLATILGLIIGVARLSPNWLLSRVAAGYVEIMRNTPLLVQLVLLYAVLLQLPSVANAVALPGSVFLSQRGLFMPRPVAEPGFGAWLAFVVVGIALAVASWVISERRDQAGRPTYHVGLLGLAALIVLPVAGWLLVGPPFVFDVPVLQRFNFTGGVVLSPELTALLVGLVIYTAAFIGEVVRGGILAVRRGQLEAAYSVGLTPMQTLRLVVFPQAMRIIVPPLTSQYLNLTKNSSLAIAIGYPDLFKIGTTMSNQTGQPVSVIVLVMATYLTISLVTSLAMNLYNRRVQVLER